MVTPYWMAKMPVELKKELDRVRLERIRRGLDKEMKSYKRLGLAMARHKKLWKDLEIAEMLEGDEYG